MNRNTALTSACLLVTLLGASACLRDESLDTNRVPVARARAIGSDGKIADPNADGGAAGLLFPYEGENVTVTLDGTASHDIDGKIVKYDWRYLPPPASDEDAGEAGDAGFWQRNAALDPKDTAKPKVSLPMGMHTFTLWVTDDDGETSLPDTITVSIGGDPTQECIDGAYSSLDDECKTCLCSQEGAAGDTCRSAIPMCDGDCYGLIGCIVTACPDFATDPSDVTCVVTNCSQWLGGMNGAMAAGSCIMPCASQCTPSITEIVTAGPGGG